MQRQILRRRARAYIRQIQQVRTADELAEVAREMNAWAKHLALEEAARDFDRAYADESSSSSKKRNRTVRDSWDAARVSSAGGVPWEHALITGNKRQQDGQNNS